uniref:Headcase middle domain-containing protein n=1 Tax=Romanomermis culicivorax TaxID=13658 RepID=A0A915J7S2_ROMCU
MPIKPKSLSNNVSSSSSASVAATNTKATTDGKMKRRRKKSGPPLSLCTKNSADVSIFNNNNNDAGSNDSNRNSPADPALGPRMRSRTLSLGSAAGLFANGHSGSAFGRLTKRSGGCASESDFFNENELNSSGSIFRRRDSLSALYASLPRWKRNGIHIKMEDDCPQGNDETRIFVLTSLGDKKMREMSCVLCRNSMVVYDRYPLTDGTFFLSPINHANFGIRVTHDGREGYLLAVCVHCLENASHYACCRCGNRDWFPGDRLILGTLYTFDVLASKTCCQPTCENCHKAMPLPATPRCFSSFSDPTPCPFCGFADLHFARRLDTVKYIQTVSG